MHPTDPTRRDALKSLAALTTALMVPTVAGAQSTRPSMADAAPTTQPHARDRLGDLLPQRKLGRTGAMVTMLGLGGSHIGSMANRNEAEAIKTIEASLEGGVRFFDSAAKYQNGGSERTLGKHLVPKYRDVVFIMTKSDTKTPADAQRELDGSLRNLNTDYIDLWQMHENMSAADVETRINNGVLDVFLDAQRKGKVRYIGFTGHATPASHLRMLELMEKKRVDGIDPLQTCQMPINVVDPSFNSFVLGVLPKLVERGYGVCAMKTLAAGRLLGTRGGTKVIPDRVTVREALHFVWSLPVSVLISGPNNAEMWKENISHARAFKAIDEEGRKALIAKVADAAGRGTEYYKT
jgi:aryl-alcohol dehydrogenase-like predicted oxidoreductase